MKEGKTGNLYGETTVLLTKHYDELQKFVIKLYFSARKFTLFSWPDLEYKSSWSTVFFHLFFPHSFFYYHDRKTSVKPVVKYCLFLVWMLVVFLWYALTRAAFTILYNNTGTQSSTSEPSIIWMIVLFSLSIFFAIAAYIQFIWHVFNRYNPWRVKILWLYGLAIAIGDFLYLNPLGQSIDSFNAGQLRGLLLTSVLYILPLILVLISTVVAFMGSTIEFVYNAWSSMFRASKPISLDLINRLVSGPIKGDTNSWHLLDLNINEIQAIQKLAEKNIDANEKKTVPSLLIFAVLGVIINTGPIQKSISSIVEWLAEITWRGVLHGAFNSIGEIVGFYLVFFLAMALISSLITQYQNFLVQGIVVQVCVVAEHVKYEADLAVQTKEEGFITKLKRLFGL